MMGFIKQLQEMGNPIRFIRCDNAGENETLKKQIDNDGRNIKFEYTARNTPQLNGRVERAFATLYGRMRAMMISVGMNKEIRQVLWTEAASTATKLDNILHNRGEASPYKKFYKQDPDYKKHLRTFGEQGAVILTPGTTMKSKLQDQGIKAIFLGYAANRAGNVCRMQNLETKKVLITRDVKWLDARNRRRRWRHLPIWWWGYLNPANKRTQEDHLQDHPEEEKEEIKPIAQGNQQPARPARLRRAVKALQPDNRPGRLEQEGKQINFVSLFRKEQMIFVTLSKKNRRIVTIRLLLFKRHGITKTWRKEKSGEKQFVLNSDKSERTKCAEKKASSTYLETGRELAQSVSSKRRKWSLQGKTCCEGLPPSCRNWLQIQFCTRHEQNNLENPDDLLDYRRLRLRTSKPHSFAAILKKKYLSKYPRATMSFWEKMV